MSDQTTRPDLRSLTHRQGDRIVVGRPPPAPNIAAACLKRYGGHVYGKLGYCRRCGGVEK